MLKKAISTACAAFMLAFAVACHQNNDDNGTAISGAVDLTTNPSKPRLAASVSGMTAVATDLDSGTTYQTTLSSSGAYTCKVITGVNLKIEIKKSNTVILSRAFSSDDTAAATVSAKINVVTHVQAKMALKVKASGGSLSAAIKQVNKEIFGSETVSESKMNIAGIVNQAFAARVLILAQVVNAVADTSPSTAVTTLLTTLSDTYDNTTVAAVGAAFTSAVNSITDSAVISAFASAFEGAKNTGVVAATVFTTVSADLSSTVNAAITAEKKAPTFGTATDSVRTAAPGVLFKYTFPTATTVDVLGISGYSGAFSTTPDGFSVTTADSNRTVKFIPSEKDVGTTFTYTETVTGANGKTATSAISIVVKAVQMKGIASRQIGSVSGDSVYMPKLGPILSGDYAYLVSQYSSSAYRLERYAKSDLNTNASAALAPNRSWILPSDSGAPQSMMAGSDRAFIATANSGVLGYDTTAASSTPDYSSSSFSATSLVLQGSSLFGIYNNTVKKANLNLSSVSTDSNLSSYSSANSATNMGAYGDYVYLASSMSVAFYNPSTSSFLSNSFKTNTDINDIFWELGYDVSGTPLYMVTSNTAYAVTISAGTVMSSALALPSVASGLKGAVTNGTYLYGPGGTSLDSVYAISVKTTSNTAVATDEGGTFTMKYTNAGEAWPMIVNVPEGIASGKSGAYMYTTGQYTATGTIDSNSATTKSTWYIKSHRVEPQ